MMIKESYQVRAGDMSVAGDVSASSRPRVLPVSVISVRLSSTLSGTPSTGISKSIAFSGRSSVYC